MSRLIKALAAVVVMSACSAALAQPAPGGGGQRGPGGPPMMRMGAPNMMGGNALDGLVVTVADLNLRPGFTLSEEQKTKIQQIRDAFKQSVEAWRKENEKELGEIQETMNSLREQGPDGDPEAWRDIMEQNMQLMQTAPDGTAEAEQLRAVLTPEQAKALETREAELEAERQAMWEQMGFGRGPGGQRRPGQQGGPGGQGPGGQNQQGGNRPGI
jgi:Spy/CpxP family protein refolding chaperone